MIIIGLALGATDVLLVWSLAATRGFWLVKVAGLVVSLTLSLLALLGTFSASGWPAKTPIPNGAQFLSCVVNEPDAASHDPGSIDFWTLVQTHKSVLSYSPNPGTPKSFEVPYSRPTHELCLRAQKLQKRGFGALSLLQNRGRLRRHGKYRHGFNYTKQGPYRLYKLPPVRLPRKDSSG